MIVLAHLTPTQRRALMIADNRIAENAGWDEAMLASELVALKDENVDLALLGFDDADLDRLLAETADESEDLDQAPEIPIDPISRPGDLWICGEHRVFCGDATVLSDVEKLLGGDLADMTFTDPPYNVNYANADRTSAKARTVRFSMTHSARTSALCCMTPASISSRSRRVPSISACRHRNWTDCRRPSATPAANGRPSSSGPRTHSPSDAQIISASTSQYSTAGRKAPIIIGAARAIRVTSGLLTSR